MQERKTCFVFHQGKLEEGIEKANGKKKKKKKKEKKKKERKKRKEKSGKKETKGEEELIQWQSLACSLKSL